MDNTAERPVGWTELELRFKQENMTQQEKDKGVKMCSQRIAMRSELS